MNVTQIGKASDLLDDISEDATNAAKLMENLHDSPVDVHKLKAYNQSIISSAGQLQRLIDVVLETGGVSSC